eukprot:TRINITY_DN1410_c0_g1_i2.p2 TRINITY_DN1410_c0_g1~~TRINITY_DN1410_c0_g1_i2.p2  ORF type:complete len:101 (-),score=4.07 TRINITY_DN1410_c0_g1_i2:246-548(-)
MEVIDNTKGKIEIFIKQVKKILACPLKLNKGFLYQLFKLSVRELFDKYPQNISKSRGNFTYPKKEYFVVNVFVNQSFSVPTVQVEIRLEQTSCNTLFELN